MADIHPFYGLRYNKNKVASLSKVFAPPYDIISEKEQKELYAQHPFNIVRLILGKQFTADDETKNRYSRAAQLFEKWQKEGILTSDEKPCIYIYTQEYDFEGKRKRRIGFFAVIKFGNKSQDCLPHEHTLSKPKEDRLKLIRAVRANLSPIFSFYLDSRKKIEAVIKPLLEKKPLINFKDKENVKHSFWKVDDAKKINQIRQLMKKKQIFIADGHHRYEVCRAFRHEMLKKGATADDKFNYVLMYFTGFSEENLSILPTHRLVKNIPGLEGKLKKLQDYFALTHAGNLEMMLKLQKKSAGFSLGMYHKGRFYTLEMKDKRLLERLMKKTLAQWRRLDVAMLNKIVFEHIFKLNEPQKEENISYTRDPDFAVSCVKKKHYALAFFPNATKPQQVKEIALSRSRMPQKSTYFYPKPTTGLVINKF
ncbi:MAG: DUF1015 domain-containing protein [Candidatus Omnitrophica bacterium]|nr:DUF1015 domain-containing protein [Candidatus Omnitrophota bacterium]